MRVDELDNLLNMEFINVYKNILINGDWGVGKTEFIKQYVKEKDNVYVSLFGIKDIESIKINIYMRLNKILGFLKNVNKKIEGVNFGISIGSMSVPYFETDIVKKLEKKTKKNKLIIVIDDLERKSTNIPMEEILGLIEELNGIKGIYVIVISNEKEIGRTDEQDKEIYNSFKEKIIQKTFNVTGYSMQARKNIINNVLQKIDNIDDKEDLLVYIENFLNKHTVLNLRTIKKSMNYMKFVLSNIDISKLRKDEIRSIVVASLAIVIETIEKIYYKEPTKEDLIGQLCTNDFCSRIIINYFKEQSVISDKRFIVSTLMDVYEDQNINSNFNRLENYFENEHSTNNNVSLFYKSKNELEKSFSDFYNNSVVVTNELLDLDMWLKKYAEIKYYAKIIGKDNLFEKSKIEAAIDKYIDKIPNIENEIQKNTYRFYNLNQYKESDLKELCDTVNKKITKKFNEILINELKNDRDNNQYNEQKIFKLFQQYSFFNKDNIQQVINLLYDNKFFLPNLNNTLTEKSWGFTHSIWSLMKDYEDCRDNKFEKYVVELLKNADEVGKYRIDALNNQYGIDISNL